MYLFENSIANKQMFVKRMFANACLKKLDTANICSYNKNEQTFAACFA